MLSMSNTDTSSMKDISPAQIVNEFLSGLTIALLLIPESIAFAFIMGLSPLSEYIIR